MSRRIRGRKRYDKNTVGRTRERLSRMLKAEGYDIEPYELSATQGRYRSDTRCDIVRWEAFFTHDNIQRSMCSWFTMTEIVRSGGVSVWFDTGTFEAGPKKDGDK